MRNSGWYIPYWRKPKKKGKVGKAGTREIVRSEEELEAVRRRWIERYRRTVHALLLMGLSVGSNRGDVQARYEELRASGAVPAPDLEEAYQHLMRALAPLERRKRRRAYPDAAAQSAATQGPSAQAPDEEDIDDDTEADEPEGELFDGADEEAIDGQTGLTPAAREEGAPGSASASGGPESLRPASEGQDTDGL